MIKFIVILISLPWISPQQISNMDPGYQLLTNEVLIDNNDNFVIDAYLDTYIEQDYAFTWGVWSRYNPLSQISQVGKFGIFDSSCFNILNAMKYKEKTINLIYYDCLDIENNQITKHIQFIDNSGQDHSEFIEIDSNIYEGSWYFFQILAWPQLEIVRMSIILNDITLLFNEFKIKYPFYDQHLTINIGGGADGFFLSDQIQFSYFPGPMLSEDPLFSSINPSAKVVFIDVGSIFCEKPDNFTFLEQHTYSLDMNVYQASYANMNYFLLAGWIKIVEIIQIEQEFTYKLLKLATKSQNTKLTDDNISPFCLYYHISDSSQQILITTYSYNFPSVTIDFTSDPYLIKEYIDITVDIKVWQYITVQLSDGELLVSFIFYDDYHTTFQRTLQVKQFSNVVFQLQIGNILSRKDNYINFIANQIQFSNCDSVVFFKDCHTSCMECKGPTRFDCLSCSIDSKRQYIQEIHQCNCPYDTIDEDSCNLYSDLSLNLLYADVETQFKCPYGYFQSKDQQCYKCPSIISNSSITCLECLQNSNDWIEMLYCTQSLVSINGATFKQITEDNQYYIIDGSELNYCPLCDESCQNEDCVFNNNISFDFLVKNYECYIKNCEICGLEGNQQFTCLQCNPGYKYQNQKCVLGFSFPPVCDIKCASCTESDQCDFCFLPYYLSSDKSECLLCDIPNCKFCFMFQINDKTISTLHQNYQPFNIDGNTRVGCSLCIDGFNYDFQREQCIQNQVSIKNCLRSFIDLIGEEICVLSAIYDFNIAPQIINCWQLIENCQQCLLSTNQIVQCIICEKGYSASFQTGQCHLCDIQYSDLCVDGTQRQDFWVQLIQSFLIQFLPDSQMYGFLVNRKFWELPFPLSCEQGYRLNLLNRCVQDCDTDCISCVMNKTNRGNTYFYCDLCPNNYYGSPSRSVIIGTCLKCSQLCLTCVQRADSDIANINSQFITTTDNVIYTYQCLQTIFYSKVVLDPINLIPTYCFGSDCQGYFEYQVINQQLNAFQVLDKKSANYYELSIDIDYCNRMGIRTFQLTIITKQGTFYEVSLIPIFLKKQIFSLQRSLLLFLGDVQPDTFLSGPFTFFQFDQVTWQNLDYTIQPGQALVFLNNENPISLTFIDSIFKGSTENTTFIQNSNFENLRMINMTLKDLHLNNMTWLEYQTSIDQSLIMIEKLTISNCVFENVIIFSILNMIRTISLSQISIVDSQFINSTFFYFNQTIRLKGSTNINGFYVINSDLISSNLIIQTQAQSLQITNFQIINSEINDSLFILTDNEANIEQLFINQSQFVLSTFFKVIFYISTYETMNYKFRDFLFQQTHFSDSNLIYINSVNNQINILFNSFQHYSLTRDSLSEQIFYLFDIKCTQVSISDIKIQNCSNMAYFFIYQTESISVVNVYQNNLFQTQKIWAIQQCSERINILSILLRIQGFKQIQLKNLTIQNQYSIDYPLISILQDLLFQSKGNGIIDVQQMNFIGNILIRQSLGTIFSLFVIYSDFSENILLKDFQFKENFFNQELDDPSNSGAGLIFIDTQLSSTILENINCISNGLTNSTYSFIMINSLNQKFTKFNVSNLNQIDSKQWNHYYQIPFQESKNPLIEFAKLIEQIFTISNIGGVCQITAAYISIENSSFSNIKAYSKAIFDITTYGIGNIILQNLTILNVSTALDSSYSVEGCITIQSQNSNLNLKVQSILFEQVYNRLDSAIFTIYPSHKKNDIKIRSVKVIDCYSLINQFLYIQFSKESISNLNIQQLEITNTVAGFIYYFQQISYPNILEINKITQDNALIQVQNGNFTLNNIFITGMFISQILLLSDQEIRMLTDMKFQKIQVLFPVNLIQLNYVSNIKSIIVMENIKITQATQISQIENQIIPQTLQEKIILTVDLKNCIFTLQQLNEESYTINDFIRSLNIQNTKTGSLILITGQSSNNNALIKNIILNSNDCNFCYDGLLLIQQQNNSQVTIKEFNCFSNKIKQYGCLQLKTETQIQSLQNSFTITNSAFFNNFGTQGVGIYSQNILITVQKSIFIQNSASEQGGGLFMQDITNDFVLRECLIFQNTAQIGGGVYLSGQSHLTRINFNQSLTLFNIAKSFSSNLVEAPRHLTLKINNIEVESIITIDQMIQMALIQPYKLFKGKNQYTSALYFPSGQQINNFTLFDLKSRVFKSYFNQFSLIWKNSLNEEIVGSDSDFCQILINIDTIIGNSVFNKSSNQFDLMDLKISHNPYLNEILLVTLKCSSAFNPSYFKYQINSNTFICQQGEFFTNNECKVCDPIYGFYSVVQNATQCSIFDENKFSEITQNGINLKVGYWRPKYSSNFVELCFKQQVFCVGGWGVGNDLCFPGHIGGLCEECDIYDIQGNGQYASSGTNQCNICSNMSIYYISPIFLLIWSFISLLLSLKSNQQTSKTFARLRATTKLYEILFKLQQDFGSILLKMFFNYLWIFSVIFTFNISFDFSFKVIDSISTPSASVATNLDCLLSKISNIELIYFRIIFMIIFISMQILLVSCGIKLFTIIKKVIFDSSTITNTFLYLFVTNQATLIKKYFNFLYSLSSLIAVRTISDEQFIQGNVSMLFYKSDHLQWVFSFILPCLLLFGVVIPISLFLILIYYAQSNSVQFRKHFGYLFNDYNKENLFWEQIRILTRTIIIIFLTTFETNIDLKACLIALTILIYKILAHKRRPYIVNNLNNLDIESAQIVSLAIFLALIKYVCEQNKNLVPSMILQIILIVLLIGLCLQYIVRLALLYSKKYEFLILLHLKQISGKYCKIGFISSYFKNKLNEKLLKKQRLDIYFQKIAAFIKNDKYRKNQATFSRNLTKFSEQKTIQFLTSIQTET